MKHLKEAEKRVSDTRGFLWTYAILAAIPKALKIIIMQALFGEADSMTTRAIAKFTTLCDLLNRAGLVEEYNEWCRHCYNAGY